MKNLIAKIFGLNLPDSGVVRAKQITPPRSIDYGRNVGRVDINKDPVFWLLIDGESRDGWVQVSKLDYDTVSVGGTWKR